jgi:tRNA threonylcarbamoyladenosine biosynthesis protein TsaB
MAHFITIQNNYDAVEFALCNKTNIIQVLSEDKTTASKNFFTCLSTLLSAHAISLSDISFLAVNQGPGPFTTLRVVIASANGISFATGIPLIGIDGLDALLLENMDDTNTIKVALLNAFSQDAYYAIWHNNQVIDKGCKNITLLLQQLKDSYHDKSITFLGNGVQLFAEQLHTFFPGQVNLKNHVAQTASTAQISLMAWQRWLEKKDLSEKLMPIYLKQTIAPAP